jgi:hypothetical protein
MPIAQVIAPIKHCTFVPTAWRMARLVGASAQLMADEDTRAGCGRDAQREVRSGSSVSGRKVRGEGQESEELGTRLSAGKSEVRSGGGARA